MKHLDDFNRFCEALLERLEAGEKTYGEVSFTKPIDQTVQDVREELLDVCGWAFILWCKMRRIRDEYHRRSLDTEG